MDITPAALSVRDVMKLTGLGRTTLWTLELQGKFPRRFRLSERRVAYIREEIETWLADRQTRVKGRS